MHSTWGLVSMRLHWESGSPPTSIESPAGSTAWYPSTSRMYRPSGEWMPSSASARSSLASCLLPDSGGEYGRVSNVDHFLGALCQSESGVKPACASDHIADHSASFTRAAFRRGSLRPTCDPVGCGGHGGGVTPWVPVGAGRALPSRRSHGPC